MTIYQKVYASIKLTGRRIGGDFEREIRRMCERFSLEWIREAGGEANQIVVPYCTVT